MGGINVNRWLLGGGVAGLVMWLLEGAASTLYMADFQASMEKLGLKFEMGPGMFAISVLVSLITGLVMIFFYAAARPRLGPGPRTAITVAVVFWLGGYFLSLVGYHMLGLFPPRMLAIWGAVGLVEMILAGLAGAKLYRE
jgi:hypothetical protein